MHQTQVQCTIFSIPYGEFRLVRCHGRTRSGVPGRRGRGGPLGGRCRWRSGLSGAWPPESASGRGACWRERRKTGGRVDTGFFLETIIDPSRSFQDTSFQDTSFQDTSFQDRLWASPAPGGYWGLGIGCRVRVPGIRDPVSAIGDSMVADAGWGGEQRTNDGWWMVPGVEAGASGA